MALIAAAAASDYPAEIALVVSNRPKAEGLVKARAAGIATAAFDHRPHGEDRQAHERLIDAALREAGVELVALAGYMRITTPWFVGAWAGKMINIHPALSPAFPGLHTHARALEAGVKLHGCTVHWVTDTLDEGPMIGGAAVPVCLPGRRRGNLGRKGAGGRAPALPGVPGGGGHRKVLSVGRDGDLRQPADLTTNKTVIPRWSRAAAECGGPMSASGRR